MAAEEYRYTSPFGGPPIEIEVYESAAAPVDQMGADLMGFLTDFRTSQREARQPAKQPEGADGTPASAAIRGQSRFDFHTKEAEAWVDPYAGSPMQVAADWWQASDGKWYPAELHPDRQAPAPAPIEAVSEPHPMGPEQQTAAGEPEDGSNRKKRFSFGR